MTNGKPSFHLPGGAVFQQVKHKHIPTPISGACGFAVGGGTNVQLITVGGTNNVEQLASQIFRDWINRVALSTDTVDTPPAAAKEAARAAIDFAMDFHRTLDEVGKEMEEDNA